MTLIILRCDVNSKICRISKVSFLSTPSSPPTLLLSYSITICFEEGLDLKLTPKWLAALTSASSSGDDAE